MVIFHGKMLVHQRVVEMDLLQLRDRTVVKLLQLESVIPVM